MHRILIACVLVASAGCTTDTDLTIAIINNLVPDDGCTVSPEDSTPIRGRGFIDAQSPTGYLFTPMVENFADSTSAQSRAQRIAFAQGAETELTFEDGLFAEGELDPELTSFTVRFSGSIEPDNGRTGFAFIVLPSQVLEAIAGKLADDGTQTTQVRADIKVFATIAGTEVESQPFVYWIEVCDGCLKSIVGACSDLQPEFVPRIGGVCNPLQDGGIVDCCTSPGQVDVCPAEPMP